ncbi:MAG: hypothetical protein ABSD62_04120 [Candidatus Limnocylindrales bacterium]|jgi:hypothetical protein
MNSIHRIGVTIAGFATVATVAGAFVVEGYTAAQKAAATATAPTAAEDPTADPTMDLAPQTIYINPVPTPAVIQVVQTPPPGQKPPVVHVIVPAPPGGDDDNGGSDD